MLIDLDEIDDLHKRLRWFSRNRWNLFAFFDHDFGEPGSDSDAPGGLRAYVLRKLAEADIACADNVGTILLSCYPRVLGYTFNPLSLFYCYDLEGRLIAVVHEVHNTFGERHCYVLPVTGSDMAVTPWIHQACDKELFVSPFAHMSMHYEFRLNDPKADQRQIVAIRAHDAEGLLLIASYVADARALTDHSLLKVFVTMPLLTLKVIGGIHWEALKLWIKRVPLFSHQPKRIA